MARRKLNLGFGMKESKASAFRWNAFGRNWCSMFGAILLGVVSFSAVGDEPPSKTDWPSFRGSGAAGVADGFSLPESWNAEAEIEAGNGVLWKAEVPGLGHSSPVVSGPYLYVATAIAEDGKAPLQVGRGGRPDAADDQGVQQWVVLCYDKQTGDEVWRATAHRGIPRATRHAKATHANSSVTVVGDRLVVCFGSEGLHCFDLQGNLQWSRDLGVVDISKYGIGWGYASSPAVHDGKIAVICDDPNRPFLAVFRLSDGEQVWRVRRDEDCERSWGTPAIFSGESGTQVVVNGWPAVVSYDFETGEELWRIRGGGDNPVPTPFEAHGNLYITSAHGADSPIYVVDPEARGDITPTNDDSDSARSDGMVWSTMRGGAYMSTPVVYGDYLYLGTSGGVLRCFDARSGEKVYEKRLGSKASMIASLVAGDGKVYCTSENGTVYVVDAGPEFRVLAENPMGEPCFASPAISEGTIYFRTVGRLLAVQ